MHLRRVLGSALDRIGAAGVTYDSVAHTKYALDFNLQAKNRALRANPPDGVPLPPPELAFLVSGSFDLQNFHDQGRIGAESISGLLGLHGRRISDFRSVLDFGCGCGRVLRHWRDRGNGSLYGCDYNGKLVGWCAENLGFGTFNVNGLRPPLPYPDRSFEFIYTISTFTHWTLEIQQLWIRELSRVLDTGGILLLTTHGSTRLGDLTPDERRRYDQGEMIVRWPKYAGENICCTFHPEEYVRSRLAPELQCLGYYPGAARDANQDVYLFTRPSASASH